MEWKKNDQLEVKIDDMSDNGEGIGKTDGFTWFIKDAVIGDRVEAKVMKVKKSYGFARLSRVLEASPYRVEPRCPVARQCGGCQLQAMDYEEQLRFKETKIRNNLARIGGLTDVELSPIIGMENPWRYRNKAQFPFGRSRDGRIVAGFYAGRTHSIIECGDCLIGTEENCAILDCIRTHMERYGIQPYDEETHSGLIRHVLIRKGFRTGELMVCLVINGAVRKLKAADELVKRLLELFPGKKGENETHAPFFVSTGACAPLPRMASISCSINRERTNVIMGQELVNLYGPGYITDCIGMVRYRISPLSFYQVNPVQTERLYATALEYAGLTGEETVWDLYCGIGTISLFLAQRAKKVFGVEIVPEAIEDARVNARLNGIENVEFFVGRAEEVLPEQYHRNHIYADVVVVDPPRKGCDIACLDTIAEMAPQRVVYVSCDSATLARDVRYLGERGYRVEKVRGCDMFPQSGHVETVCLLSKLHEAKHHVNVTVDVDEMDLVKAKHGIIERENYNLPKSENSRQPGCPEEKVKAIEDALRHFQMI
ncbi:MAG: 23S rRNA (uracil(1939)-C(5))-methyltransferase RlmD [Clostridiales bacterium]|nr:23S rRNA (uracil(1939)-C(5))-methyltransferase RlmD [Clostridiales bacterium]